MAPTSSSSPSSGPPERKISLRTVFLLSSVIGLSFYSLYTSASWSSDHQHERRLQQPSALASTNGSSILTTSFSKKSNRVIRNSHIANNSLSSPVIHYYVQRRSDRSGAAIWDYLNAHAYTFRVGAIYGGACGIVPKQEHLRKRSAAQHELLQEMGLLSSLPMTMQPCPSENNRTHSMMNFSSYFERDANRRQSFEAFTPEWTAYMRKNMKSFLHQPTKELKKKSANEKTMVVHIRRGDVEPCDLYTQERYLTNQYYIDTIQDYMKKSPRNETTRVIIHSQNRSFEPWSDFESLQSSSSHHNRNFTIELKLDAPLIDVWYDMIVQADILVLSKSTFSTTPAVLSSARTVLCWPFPWCHSRWIQVSAKNMQKEEHRKDKLIKKQCSSLVDWRDLKLTNRTQFFERMGESVS